MTVALKDIPRLSDHLELSARRVVEGLYGGRHRSPFTSSAVEFNDHRAYLPGDDLRSIDWKAYARSDHLLIRRYREERDLPVTILLDASASMDYGMPAKNAWAMLAAASIGLLAIDQGDRVQLAYGPDGIAGGAPESGGPAALARFLDILRAITWTGRGEIGRLIEDLGRRAQRKCLMLVLSDLLGDPAEFARAVSGMRARGHDIAVIQILDRSEVSLPAEWGQANLEDPEGALPAITCDASAMKTAYDAAMHNHIAACRQALAGAQADHILAITDQDVADVLGQWLHRQRRRS